ncbi:bifunctional adenosylcobinamide kinase/adenosylcobinamide-phosphate guanylyltransferase [Alkalicoccus halolimnae]|uniref:Bifunctional adenosylcobinamide kinase/adenosylcobinamide-phosphate guanylyltransferase n=1 Tax=Alkalicoccus halolimnae TaxID=1667239 RepID=A0A5C7F4B1_9BACI|nr:bifunctional adenosylcobinamide kinase/adenosylcobinamide-phosphate guanylyltransferase [Alkalicoccus halolimnae]TXF82785.1 hypothetical protein FTX54_14250 [Alkalicoccus halolimnae]
MHVVIGGAFAGKRDYVNRLYPEAEWIPPGTNYTPERVETVIFGIENWLQQGRTSQDFWKWLHLLQAADVVLIIEEMGQGIVPADAGERHVRDENGWLSQRAVREAATVDYLWHGLVKRWKG